jgi:trk system potassium uptake protein TrkH
VLVFEDQPPLFVLYEATSAFGSVGCSTGIEAKMGPVGKLILTLTMMIGRVGPLTFALAAAGKPRATTLRLPEERVMIG